MDLTAYYQKIRDEEAKIAEKFPVIASKESGDGGKAGHLTEVAKDVAARMIVQGLARLAELIEVEAFRDEQRNAMRRVEDAASIAKVQMSVVPTAEFERLKSAAKSKE